ncbi:cytochrome P450 [Rhodococcus sp. NPDC003318]|uniref:cytochrome P450 n=1 Tax=Rhodococcus sp. NPDC003318 TaxID=3364503 RepID=UPI003686C608
MTTTLPRSSLPHPPHRLPVLGDVLTADPSRPAQHLTELAATLGPIFDTRIFRRHLTVVSGTDLYADLCDDRRFGKHIGFSIAFAREVVGDALFSAYTTEPNWVRAHNILQPAFSLSAMKNYHDTMLRTARQLIAYWDSESRTGPVDVHTGTSKMTLQTIGLIGFGHDFHSFDRADPDPYAAAVMRGFAYMGRSAYRLPIRWLDRVVHHRTITRVEDDIAYTRRVVDDVIRARKQDPENAPDDDLLALMLTNPDPESGRLLGDANVRNQVLTFLNAGHETTAGALSFALYQLATHPTVADRARTEIQALWPAGTDPDPAFSDVHRLRYLRRALDESLRLWPIAPAFFREPLRDTLLGGRYHLPAGQPVLALTMAVHRDPVWGPDPTAFDPDRFLPENSRTRPPGVYKPFGTGLRQCIGRQLALHESVLALALILHRFDLEPVSGDRLEVAEEFTLKPVNLRLRLHRR